MLENIIDMLVSPSPMFFFVLVLLIFIFLDVINPLLSDIAIFTYFAWVYTNIEGSSNLATFYLIGMLFVIVLRVANRSFSLQGHSEINTRKILGLSLAGKLPVVGVGAGIVILIIMRMLQGVSTASIIGVPSLAISSDITNLVSISLLGIVETRLFFSLYNLVKVNIAMFSTLPVVGLLFAVFSPIMPILMISVLFGVFHISAYALSVSAIIFAVMVMVIWVLSYEILDSDLPANIAHYLWNGLVVLGKSLKIIGG